MITFIDIKMPACCIPGCSKRTKKGIKIFMARFPRNKEKEKLWIASIGKDWNWKSTTDLFVCEVNNMYMRSKFISFVL